MVALSKVVLASCATAAVALSVSACGGSTSSTVSSASSAASSAASAASSAASSATSAIAAAAAEGTLASVCTEIDGVMMGSPDADPAGTAKALEAIKAKVDTPDAELLENVAAAYTALAANPNDADAQGKLQTSAKALGAGCQSATTAPGHN